MKTESNEMRLIYDFYEDFPLFCFRKAVSVARLTGYTIDWILKKDCELHLLLQPRMEHRRLLVKLRRAAAFRLFIMEKRLQRADSGKRKKSILLGIKRIKSYLEKLNRELGGMEIRPTYDEIVKIFGSASEDVL